MRLASRKYCCLFISLLFISSLFGQDKLSEGFKISSNYSQGFILPEIGWLDPFEQDPVRTLDISFSRQTNGKNQWSQLYNYPEYGVAIYHTYLGNDEILGRVTGADYFFKINFIDNNYKLYGRTAFGINYISKTYDEEANPLNVAISSNFNFHFNIGLGSSFSITEKFAVNLGVTLDHFSNANTTKPNLGINTFSVYAGLQHQIQEKSERKLHELERHYRKTYPELMLNFGMRNLRYPTQRYYYTPSLLLDINNETFRILHFGAGLSLSYDESVEPIFEIENREYENNDSYLVGVHITQAFVYNKFRFVLQEGYYFIMSEDIQREKMYSRIIFKYQLSNKFSMHFSLKSHLQKLDYNEVGIGYKI